MITKEILEGIATYDEYREVPDYDKLKDDIELIKKAKDKLHRYNRYFELRKLLEELGERESDIHIVSHAKSGTTLTQMMLYQMTTDGIMDFDHLYDVSPWPLWSIVHNTTIQKTNNRRLFKSHDPYPCLSHIKKGKFLFLIRNPLDVLVSWYHHSKDYSEEKRKFEDWAPIMLEAWYKYNEAWLKNENNLDILYLNYEDTISNKEQQVKRIAKFVNSEITPSILDRVVERSSFNYMKKHETKFGEQPNQNKVYDNFIRKGKSGEGTDFISDELQSKFEEIASPYFKVNEITKDYYKR